MSESMMTDKEKVSILTANHVFLSGVLTKKKVLERKSDNNDYIVAEIETIARNGEPPIPFLALSKYAVLALKNVSEGERIAIVGRVKSNLSKDGDMTFTSIVADKVEVI